MRTVSQSQMSARSRYQPNIFSTWFSSNSYSHSSQTSWRHGVFADDADGNDDEAPPPESPPFDPGGPPVHTD